jgi:hypothetical protein
VSLVIFAKPFACHGIRLAWESSCEDVDGSSMNREVCLFNVSIGYCVREVMFKDFLWKGFYLAMKDVVPTHPFGCKIKATDSTE